MVAQAELKEKVQKTRNFVANLLSLVEGKANDRDKQDFVELKLAFEALMVEGKTLKQRVKDKMQTLSRGKRVFSRKDTIELYVETLKKRHSYLGIELGILEGLVNDAMEMLFRGLGHTSAMIFTCG